MEITAGRLDAERAATSFNIREMTELLNGGAEVMAQQAKWTKLFEDDPVFDQTYDVHDDRGVALKKSVGRTVAAHQLVKRTPSMLSTHVRRMMMQGGPGFNIGEVSQSGPSAASNHFGIGLGAIAARGSEEQVQEWVRRCAHLNIICAYAQTELGHGSNVRGLETIATYDSSTQEFDIHSPTLTSMKWWPGAFALIASHAVVYARLILDGKDRGICEFMVQLRDQDHKPMPGVEIYELGPKMGYNLVDNGAVRFTHVRIPRTHMLAKFQHVNEQGELVRSKKAIKKSVGKAAGKMKYIVMITTRVSMVSSAQAIIAKAATIAVRYSAVRLQGFRNTRENSMQSGERAVLDYKVQQYRVFKALAMAYAFNFVKSRVNDRLVDFRRAADKSGDVSGLPELHASAAALKAFCTNWAGDQIEVCRRCCGGHGVLMCGGAAPLVATYNSIGPIAEGDKIVLALQTARFLVRQAQAAKQGKPVSGQAAYLTATLDDRVAAKFDASPEACANLQTLVDAFRGRAKVSVQTAASQFEARLAEGKPFDEAWNESAVALVKCAEDHTVFYILSAFAESVSQLRETHSAGLVSILGVLARHYGLVELREHGMDFVGLGLTQRGVTNINAAVERSLDLIRPEAVGLVDSFNFPDVKLGALGRYDGNVYEALFDYAKKSPLNDPAYADDLYQTHLSKVLDKEYIAEQAKLQRAKL